jgi:uncharacterized damage-inducible protein DinB
MTDRSHQRGNDESRERMARLLATLTPAQMAVDLGEGWTVASAVAHMGFWDRWQAARWQEMLAGTWSVDEASVLVAEHLANEALHPYWAGIDGPALPALAMEAASDVDALIAQAPDSLVDSLDGGPNALLLHRHRHRGDHLDQIRRGLDAAAASPAAKSAAAPVDRSFVERNAASRQRLASIVERLRATDLQLPCEAGGWTIAQVLGHLAFWDRSMAVRWHAALESAGDGGELDPVRVPNELTEAVNSPLADLLGKWTGLLGTAIAAETLAAAEAVDSLLESIADRIPASLAERQPRAVNRWSHRELHLDQVERALAATRAPAPPVDRSYLQRNEASLTRLTDLAGRLTSAELALRVGDGAWTVGQVLGHMAFWDRFLTARWRAVLASGAGEQPTYLPHELADMLNDGLPPVWGAFSAASGSAAIEDTLAAAQAVDGIIAGLPVETPVEAILAERPALLDRSIHRLEHLSAIELALTER